MPLIPQSELAPHLRRTPHRTVADAGCRRRSSDVVVSTYVGHAEVGNTYWYLSAAPELMAVAAGRFASFVAQTEVPHA
jgi:hypothetical protein